MNVFHFLSLGWDQNFPSSQHYAVSGASQGPHTAVAGQIPSLAMFFLCFIICWWSVQKHGLVLQPAKIFFLFPWGSHYSEDICVLHAASEQNVTKSSCQYSAEMCLGEQSFHFLHAGPCLGNTNIRWAIERAKLSTNSMKKVPCGYDTCYDWEYCPGMASE